MIKILYVGVGGFLGSVARYLLSDFVQKFQESGKFPLGTLIVNIFGCFLMGFLANVIESKGLFSEEIRLFMLIGILGGFTTFSSFGQDTLNFYKNALYGAAIMNVFFHIILCLGAVGLGYFLSKTL